MTLCLLIICNIEWSSQLKFAASAKHPNYIATKWVPSKAISNDLAIQNCFESLLGDDQKAHESCPTILTTNILESI